MKRLGLITIGESPREDVTPILKKAIPDHEIVQSGVLDRMTKKEAESAFMPNKDDKYILTSRFQNGDSVVMSREKITPIVQEKITQLEDKGISIIFLLCTGVFQGLKTRHAFLIEPEKVIPPIISGILGDKKLGIIGPLKKQENILKEKWGHFNIQPIYEQASPYNYEQEEIRTAAQNLIQKGADIILLDCMGYVETMKLSVEKEVEEIPVVLSNSLLAKVISEFL
jgi:protein AroM